MDLFTLGQGGAGQVHDLTPGVLANGLFWTIAIPDDAFVVYKNSAHLKLKNLPLCDAFFFGNAEGVASQVSCSVQWHAESKPQERGLGKSVPPTDQGAFLGKFADASCTATVRGGHTGFKFSSVGKLDASGFFAEFGSEKNGSFL